MLVSLIAVHRAASGDAARAIPLLEAAADAALALGAAAEAAAFWRTAAGLARIRPPPSTTGRGRKRRSRRPAAAQAAGSGAPARASAGSRGRSVIVSPATAGRIARAGGVAQGLSSARRAGA